LAGRNDVGRVNSILEEMFAMESLPSEIYETKSDVGYFGLG
jgi:hypothetical protein